MARLRPTSKRAASANCSASGRPVASASQCIAPLARCAPPRLHGVLLHDRVGGQPVGRRHHAQPLAGEELRHVDVVRRHARHARGLAPEGFAVAKAGAQHAEWPRRPGRVAKARVVVGTAGGLFAAVTGRPAAACRHRAAWPVPPVPSAAPATAPGARPNRPRPATATPATAPPVSGAALACSKRSRRWVGDSAGWACDASAGWVSMVMMAMTAGSERAGARAILRARPRIGLMYANLRVTPGAVRAVHGSMFGSARSSAPRQDYAEPRMDGRTRHALVRTRQCCKGVQRGISSNSEHRPGSRARRP